jgi:hypothetical protein
MRFLLLVLIVSCGSKNAYIAPKDGANGADGFNSLILSEIIPILDSRCNGVGGLSLKSYLDKNRNELFDGNELAFTLGNVCNGEQGPQGVAGAAGAQGLNGVDGEDGVQGIPGIQGPAGPQGAQGLQGIQGDRGEQGEQGLIGATGPQGQPGVMGLPGNNASFKTVKLCPGDNATFPEYGFVVDGYIYAVYYGQVQGTLSAFLARLNAGSYITTNDNTPCSFSVSYSNGNAFINGNNVSN